MFTFRLQSLLDVRIACEEKVIVEVAEIVRRFEREQEVLKSLKNERSLLCGQLELLQGSPTRSPDLSLLVSYLWSCHEREKAQEDLIDGVRRDLDAKREDLLAAVKDRKIMEKLKIRQLEHYRDHIEDRERKDLDEMAITRFGRRDR
jgi:flagellar FliJ protein